MARVATDIMLKDFVFVDSNATVAEAEELFEQTGVFELPVLNPDRTVFGLLTTKHLAQFYRRPMNHPGAFHAWEICNARPLLASPATPVDALVNALLEPAFEGCILVVNDTRELVGVVTSQMLVRHYAEAGVLPAGPSTEADRAS